VSSRPGSARISTDALLLRRVEYRDADLVLTFLSAEHGKLSALARGARKSSRRFGGALEPMHTLSLELSERPGAELLVLHEAKLKTPRPAILEDLASLEAAGKALSWARRAVPFRTPETMPYAVIEALLDRLAARAGAPRAALAEAGLALLPALGWGIDFERCVRCGRAAAPEQAASVDPGRGGLVCRACGGAPLRLGAAARQRMARAAAGETGLLDDAESALALELVERALGAHAGID
jgi:DNA repair protein RecO (recombination protein O)